ncbi:zinc finger protein 14-like isoform X1 [Bombus impatiens]|uniref:Zinc finger protein 14-like isoform X1 n=2 Tax=Bombus impatiens TaxID=132113 RepID=A0A6P6FC60_BOMIM|nr:zinc finger protein 14-like isoform X1 [Bombus impatiens]XP_033176208.1 zinc finger protein 14-like isoform X1 [Bombus impatiens]XP_033176209.1 zinc finger protein 14-like isoform X1 [Bombus impatiens]
MARVLVYARPVDAIFMDINLGSKTDPSEYAIRIKEEPIDPEICDDLSPVDTNTENENETAMCEGESSDSVYCRNRESAFPRESTYLENNKSDPDKRKSKHKVPSNNRISCNVCLLTFRTKHLLELHNKLYSCNVFKCNNCTAIFSIHIALIRHLKTRCRTKQWPGYRCNFCNRSFSYKRYIQSHLFHMHGNAILSGESKITKTSPESLGKSNHSDDIVMAESNTSHNSSPKSVNSSINISLKLSNSSNDTPTKGSDSKIKSTHPKWLNDSYGTPSKRMKQTVLTDFISLYKDKPNEKWVSPKEVIDTENIPVTATIIPTSTLETFSNKTSTASEVIQMSTSVKRIESPVRKRPFVQIHVNSKTMISLLKNEIGAESEGSNTSHNISYNLRPLKRCSSSLYNFYDLLEFEAFGRSRQSFKRNKSRYPFNQSERSAPEAKCKECVVRLEKCDKFLEPTSFVSNGDKDEKEKENENEDGFKQAVSKNVKEKFEGFRETSSAGNLPLETGTIASKRFNEFVKSFVHRLIVPRQESAEFKKNSKVDQQKIFQCHICKKSFSLKENLREHVKLSHAIYMSSICNARYTSMNKLLTHYLRQHIVFKRRECCVCYEKFDTSALLKRHMILHCLKTIRSKKDVLPVDVEINCKAFKKQHKCQGCRKRFWLYSCLKQHENVCRRMKVSIHKQRVPRVNHLSRSLKEPSDMKLGIVQSPDLEQTLDVPDGMTRPLENYLAPSTLITDDTFSSSFDTAAKNKRLLNGIACVKGYQADKMNGTKFPCTTCGTQFRTFQNLCIHERTYCQTATKKCNVCNTMFSTKRLLQLHMLATHTPSCSMNYKFFCKFCNQGFVKKSRVQIHERHFHIGENPRLALNSDCVLKDKQICNICHLLFESYEHFVEHNTYYYKGKDFLCAVCGKSFQGMYKFHHHNKLEHYPDELWKSYPHKCDTCNEGFSYESHLHAHKLHVHSHDSPADEARDHDTSDQIHRMCS